MNMFVLPTSDTFMGFNVFFKSLLYISIPAVHPKVKTVGFLVDIYVNLLDYDFIS